jgi:uncharacterized protein YajQ (UPF0234 family)
MPSFDVVSKLNLAELINAVSQAKKELATRYDFQGTKTDVELAPDQQSITLKSSTEDRVDAAYEILLAKLHKRGVSLRSLSREKREQMGLGMFRQLVKLQQGIPVEKSKELVKILKESKIKAQASIQGEELRVSGKNRDDLQAVIALFRQSADKVEIDMQFTNFRE